MQVLSGEPAGGVQKGEGEQGDWCGGNIRGRARRDLGHERTSGPTGCAGGSLAANWRGHPARCRSITVAITQAQGAPRQDFSHSSSAEASTLLRKPDLI